MSGSDEELGTVIQLLERCARMLRGLNRDSDAKKVENLVRGMNE